MKIQYNFKISKKVAQFNSRFKSHSSRPSKHHNNAVGFTYLLRSLRLPCLEPDGAFASSCDMISSTTSVSGFLSTFTLDSLTWSLLSSCGKQSGICFSLGMARPGNFSAKLLFPVSNSSKLEPVPMPGFMCWMMRSRFAVKESENSAPFSISTFRKDSGVWCFSDKWIMNSAIKIKVKLGCWVRQSAGLT